MFIVSEPSFSKKESNLTYDKMSCLFDSLDIEIFELGGKLDFCYPY